MATKPVWGPTPEQVANDKLNQMVEYSEALAGVGALFRAADPQPAGLLFSYLSGRIRKADGSIVEVAAGQVSLTASATNYIKVDNTGSVSASTATFSSNDKPIATVVCDSGSKTSITDKRIDFDFADAADKSFAHTQLTPATTWTITHNLGKFPSVTIVDSGGSVVTGDVAHASANQATVSFTAAFAGKAYCN